MRYIVERVVVQYCVFKCTFIRVIQPVKSCVNDFVDTLIILFFPGTL